MIKEQKLALWNKFCAKHQIDEAGVPLFVCDDRGRAASAPFGRDSRLILQRSPEMEALIVHEVSKTLSTDSLNEGVLYTMHWREQGHVIPLYIGRAGKYGKGGANISANLLDIERDTSKFARWGSGYAYHIGDLSAAACTGHRSDKAVKKYHRWAQRLFHDAPTSMPTLRRPVYFWATAWNPDCYSIWPDFGSCALAFQEYLLIGVAAQLFSDTLLNDEGVNRSAPVCNLSTSNSTMTSTEFYERNADAFYHDTVATDMAPIYAKFLPRVRAGGKILDAGCGSGRDTLAFLQHGYQVDAFDGSSEMVRRASALTRIEVRQLLFENMVDTPLAEKYDGIWCCASLLHVERNALPSVMGALRRALTPGGIMYVSFKYGETDRVKDGRKFTDLNEEELDQILATVGGCELDDCWVTNDQRPGRADSWLNAIVRTL